MLGEPHVLEAGAIGSLDRGELVEERMVLGIRIAVAAELRHVPLDEQTEFHAVPPCRRRI